MERKMKNQSENVWGGALLSYEAPRVEVLEVSVEKGFAISSAEGGDNASSFEGTTGSWGND
jgi:hypothetical protein